MRLDSRSNFLGWNECPDEEGIKTRTGVRVQGLDPDGMNALMKKGLRPIPKRFIEME